VLGGWIPEMAPLILSHPQSVSTESGTAATFQVTVAAVPEPRYQWFKNGEPIKGATDSSLTLKNASASDEASYTVMAKNGSGTAASNGAVLKIRQ